jgi:predicted ATPase
MLEHNYKPTEKELKEAENHLDRLADIKLVRHSKTLLVGENACGKSLFRQIVRTGKKTEDRPIVFHASMQIRTSSNPSMGALSSMAQDLPWLATSHSTLGCVEQVLKQADRCITEKRPFGLCIDEPEIGLGAGAQRGLANWLFPELNKRAEFADFTIVISHSPIFVKAGQQLAWDFLDLSLQPTKNPDEWLQKQADETYVITPDHLLAKASTLFVTVRDRLNKNSKTK